MSFVKYCTDCKLNLCINCINSHLKHNLINLGNILHDKYNNKLNQIKEEINKLYDYINEIINKFNVVKICLDNYYNLYKDLVTGLPKNNNNNNNFINYEIMKNLDDIYCDIKFNDIYDILHIYNLMTNQDKILKYYPNGVYLGEIFNNKMEGKGMFAFNKNTYERFQKRYTGRKR